MPYGHARRKRVNVGQSSRILIQSILLLLQFENDQAGSERQIKIAKYSPKTVVLSILFLFRLVRFWFI